MNKIIQPNRWLAGILVSMAIVSAQAAEFNQLQPQQSEVAFVFTQMNVPIDGKFRQFTGKLSFNPAKPTLAKAEISIALASIDAGSDEANDEVAGKLWFDTKTYPSANFVATEIKPLGDNRFNVTGTMRIKGKTHTVSTPATFTQDGNRAVFAGSFILKRADFGIGEGVWADFGTVANEIQIKFKLVATAAAGKK